MQVQRNHTLYIDRSRSTSIQLQRLERTGIISVLRLDKNNQFYRLKNKSRIVMTVKNIKSRCNV